jgi:acyl transferase domain-containing protein
MLKPLDQAIKDNDHIRAVIRATGSNQDGRTNGITVPNGNAQIELMRSVYEKAGLDVSDTGFVEAHGTGTKVGDPIEVSALHEVFGAGRTPKTPLYIGSVKSNVGHLEGASGIISVIKAAMMLEKGMILPNINFEKANEAIPFEKWNLKVPTSVRPWPRNKRYISVNNFGFGGTNAHIVLERAPSTGTPVLPNVIEGSETQKQNSRKLYVLSANDKQTVEKQKTTIGVYLEQRPEVFQNKLLGNLAYTLGQRRSHLAWKVAISADGSSELIPKLASADTMPVRAVNEPTIGFVFTGQGAQTARMGYELLSAYPVFKETLKAADHHLLDLGADFSLIGECFIHLSDLISY